MRTSETTRVESAPLTGLRVLDLTQALAGPFATMILADLGADVVKVESPRGDLVRTTPPHYIDDVSLYFLANNRNKRGIVLNLKSDGGQQVFRELVECSDVVFWNFRPDVAVRLGLTVESLRTVNPRIITCCITGYGKKGPEATRAGVDLVVQGIAGAMSITGEPGRPPVRAGVPTADLAAALYAVIGILAALEQRRATGRAVDVETSLLHAQISLLNYMAAYYLHSDVVPGPVGSGHIGTVPSQAFECNDGWIVVDAGFDHHFRLLCDILERPELAIDRRFRDRPSRNENRAELISLLGAIFRTRSIGEWLERLDGAGIMCGRVNDLRDALALPQCREYDMIRHLRYGDQEVKVVGTPIWLDQHLGEIRSPPRLGEHTRRVLDEILGYTDEEITRLADAGVIELHPEDLRRAPDQAPAHEA